MGYKGKRKKKVKHTRPTPPSDALWDASRPLAASDRASAAGPSAASGGRISASTSPPPTPPSDAVPDASRPLAASDGAFAAGPSAASGGRISAAGPSAASGGRISASASPPPTPPSDAVPDASRPPAASDGAFADGHSAASGGRISASTSPPPIPPSDAVPDAYRPPAASDRAFAAGGRISASSSPPPVVPGKIFFKVIYMERSEEFLHDADEDLPAKVAIKEACEIAAATYSKQLGKSEYTMDLTAYPSFPYEFGGRELSMKEWHRLGQEPFLAVGLMDRSQGFTFLLAEARKQVDDLKKMNEDLMLDGLKVFGLAPSESRPCQACRFLSASIQALRFENAEQKNALEALKAENARKTASEDSMRAVRRRILLEKARRKALRDLGLKKKDVETWQVCFSKHAKKLKGEHGVSNDLHFLLMHGQGFLNKMVHEGLIVDLADAVIGMAKTQQKVQFCDAFTYVFGCTPESIFE